MQTKSERIKRTEAFYEWLLKIGNIYLADREKMNKAFEKVYNA